MKRGESQAYHLEMTECIAGDSLLIMNKEWKTTSVLFCLVLIRAEIKIQVWLTSSSNCTKTDVSFSHF